MTQWGVRSSECGVLPFPFRIPHSAFRISRRALTLVELLIAMTMLVIVVGSTMLLFRGITRAWRSGQLRTERYQQARLLSDLFLRELSSAVVDRRYPFLGHEHALWFVGTLPGREGLVERSYALNAQAQLLCGDQQPPDGDAATISAEEVCGTDIAEFNVSYAAQAFPLTWASAWEGQAGGAQEGQAPKAIRILVTIGTAHGESFETLIHVPTS